MPIGRRYYTTFEASHFLGVSLPTVVNWIKASRLKAHRTPGGHRRIAREELAGFIRRHGMPMPPELEEEGAAVRVLLVHEADTAESDASVFRRAGFACAVASSGLSAGLAVGEFKPDLLVIDLNMICLDPIATVAELRGRPSTACLPVIGLSDAPDDEQDRRARSARFDGLLQRPFDLGDLKRTVDNALRARRAA